MPVDKSSSIVMDSTLGSSPSHVQTPKIKRATYTYGRRRPASPDAHSSSSASSSGSRESVFKTGLHHQDEEVPPSSEASRWPSDSEPAGDDSEEDDGPQKFAFDWKQKLRDMDEEEDFGTTVDVNTIGHDLGVNAPMSSQGAASKGSFPGSSYPPSVDFDVHEDISRPATDATGSNPSGLSPQSSHRSRIHNRNPNVLRHFSPSFEVSRSPAKQATGSPTTSAEEMPRNTSSESMAQNKKKASRPQSSLESDDDQILDPPRKELSKPRRQGKIKPPTKKELAETAKSRLRIAAEQEVSIPRLQTSGKYSMSSFLSSIARPESTSAVISSDPILPFSSSPSREDDHTTELNPRTALPHSPPRQVEDIFGTPSSLLLQAAHVPPVDKQSRSLHAASSITQEDQIKRTKELMDLKQRAAAMQAAKIEQHFVENNAEEDDLDIVFTSPKKEVNLIIEEEARRSGKKRYISEVQMRQLKLGGVATKRIDSKTPKKNDLASLLDREDAKKSKGKSPVTHADLNKALMKKINEDSLSMARKKEEEWVRRGGKIAKESAAEQQPSSLQEVWKSYAKKSLEVQTEKQKDEDEDDGEDSDGDGDWDPALRGSASPVPGADDEEGETDGNHDRGSDNDSGDALVEGDRRASGTIDEWNAEGKGPRPIRRTALRIDSDSELDDGENMAPTGLRSGKDSTNENSAAPSRIPPTRQHIQSFSSDEPTEDEGDKENDQSLAFDDGGDKENVDAVRSGARHALATSSRMMRDHSVSPTPRGRALTHDHGPGRPEITPFRAVDDDSFTLDPGSSTIASFADRLRRSSSQKSSPTPPPLTLERSPGFEPFLNAGGKNRAPGFSQFLDDEESVFLAAPFQGGLSELFEEGTEKPKPRGLSKTLSKTGKVTLGLTQDIELDAALQVRNDLLQKADAIFEREQEDILASTTTPSKQEIYINELGFLTQTRPDGSSPEVYKFNSPSQASFRDRNVSLTSNATTSSGGRQPLRTISFTQIDFQPESPSQAPRRRLRRIDESPVLASSSHQLNRPSRSPSPSRSASARKRNQPVNAFDLLGKKGKQKEGNPRKRLQRSDFVEAEAEESDEENKFGFGFGIKKDDEEEEDGEDLDKTLETLVDDRAMDETTLAAERVLEKFKEQEEQEDQELEKLHQAAVQGELRRKRRSNGIGFDDSGDDSDEDERNRGIRKGMYKKQKIDRDSIKALGNNDETKSFYKVYEHALIDDDMELEYLRQPEQDIVMMTGAVQSTHTITETQPDHDESDYEEEEYDSHKYITRDEIIRRVRELGQRPQGEIEESLNPHDVSWIDDEMSTEDFGRPQVRVKEMSSKRPARRLNNVPDGGLIRGRGAEVESADIERPGVTTTIMEGERDRDRLQSWAKAESRSRVAGTTGRSVGGAAITGHVTARSRTKQGGGSFRSGHAVSKAKEAEAKEKPQTKPLAAMPSVLAGVSDRSSRFA